MIETPTNFPATGTDQTPETEILEEILAVRVSLKLPYQEGPGHGQEERIREGPGQGQEGTTREGPDPDLAGPNEEDLALMVEVDHCKRNC